ncbi:MAG: hypothetical protein QXV46_07550, partial [Candidatus Bathyarchaeia archaeon]
MTIDLRSLRDSTLIGAIGELIAWKYLESKGISVYRFGSTFYPGIHRNQADLSHFFSHHIESLSSQQTDYLKNIYMYESRRWDFIGIKYKYKSKYGKRRVQEVTSELRNAIREKDEKEIMAKKTLLERLLQKFRILEIYLIEVKTRSTFTHNFKSLLKGRGKIQRNILYAKSIGFKPLLIVIELLENWKFRVFYVKL